jgi:hypothetical protein
MEMLPYPRNQVIPLRYRQGSWRRLTGPDRLGIQAVLAEPGDEVPVDVRDEVSEQFVVDLDRMQGSE